MMRNVTVLYLAIAGIVLCAMSVQAAPDPRQAASRYNEANRLYQDGSFADALGIYEELVESGIRNPDLYYNAANASYRAGHLGRAILYLERAKKLAPSDNDILANLTYLNSIKADQDQPVENAVVEFIGSLYNRLTVNTVMWWSAITFFLMMAGATGFIFTSGWHRKALLATGAVMAVIFLTMSGIAVEKIYRYSTVIEAVVITDTAEAYSGPGSDNTHIFTIHEGAKVVVERGQGDWLLIRLKSGAGGWINGESLVKI